MNRNVELISIELMSEAAQTILYFEHEAEKGDPLEIIIELEEQAQEVVDLLGFTSIESLIQTLQDLNITITELLQTTRRTS